MGEVGKLSFGFLKFNKLNTSNIDLYDIHCPIKSYMVIIKERNHFSTPIPGLGNPRGLSNE